MQKKSKKELRLERALAKHKKQQVKNIRLNCSVKIKDKFIRCAYIPALKKTPRAADPNNYKKNYFSWCHSQADIIGAWRWNEQRQWSDNEYSSEIEPHMDSHHNDSWAIIELKNYNGKGGYRQLLNKCQPLYSLCKEAQDRWSTLEFMSQFDELFRFRLGTNKRIWGVRVEHHFFIVWYERYHKICPI